MALICPTPNEHGTCGCLDAAEAEVERLTRERDEARRVAMQFDVCGCRHPRCFHTGYAASKTACGSHLCGCMSFYMDKR